MSREANRAHKRLREEHEKSMIPAFQKSSDIDYQSTFSMPLGVMLQQTGILTQSQFKESGLVQAEMIAIRTAIENGTLKADDAKGILGADKKGNINFSTLSKCTEEERSIFLKVLGIDKDELKAARIEARQVLLKGTNVNAGHDIEIPAIGLIHTDLHAKNIPHFEDIKQGALIMQRALDAVKAVNRMDTDKPDATAGSKRGFKLWGDETHALKDIVLLTKELNDLEKAGGKPTPEQKQRIGLAFDAAAVEFKEAGQDKLAAQALKLKTELLEPRVDSSPKPASSVAPTSP